MKAAAASLFPRAERARLPTAAVAAGYCLAVAVLSGLALLRQSGVAATSTVWAEDGATFYAQALKMPIWQTLATTYNGYIQLVPRLLVQLARLSPPSRASDVFAWAGAVSFAATACLVFHMAKGHIVGLGPRLLLVAVMALFPIATAELLDNLVNVPWWLFFAAFWALLWRPQNNAECGLAALACFTAAASEPLVGLFIPLVLLRAFALPALREHWAGAGLAAGLVYEGAVRLTGAARSFTPATVHGIAPAFAERTGLVLLGGEKGSNWLIMHNKAAAVALGSLVVCAVVGAALVLPGARTRAFGLAAGAFSVICFVVPVWLRGVGAILDGSSVGEGSRYEAVPLLLLASTVLVVADHLSRPRSPAAAHLGRRRRRRRRIVFPAATRAMVAPMACVVLFLPSWVADFDGANSRSAGPAWAGQVAHAAAQCRSSGAPSVMVPIDPTGWTAVVPCPALLR